jgi:hypothetical protein
MYDIELLYEKLIQISPALDRVARRFNGIHSADDFLSSEDSLGYATFPKALIKIIVSPDFGTHLYIFPRWPIFNTRTQTTLS